MRKARIVCTIGPATASEAMLTKLIQGGMDVARLNFSHGNHETHGRVIDRVRKISKKLGKNVAILQDLQGVKIRIGALDGEKVVLKAGAVLTVRTGDKRGDAHNLFIAYKPLIRDAKEGDIILLDDGLICLQVKEKKRNFLVAQVLEGGELKERKGVSLPNMKIDAPSFTEKDIQDSLFGLQKGVDYIALSFVRSARDVSNFKEWLARQGADVPVIAKIEKPEAIDDIDAIVAEADGIMVARGDLGVEMPLEKVPLMQKMLISKANEKRKLVITATQMLESMVVRSRPTRAEVTDVANAVIDGTDALMLSAETSAGKYPVEALSIMEKVISYTESSYHIYGSEQTGYDSTCFEEFPEAIARAAAEAADTVGAKAIVVFTRTGLTARLISKCRPGSMIIAFSPLETVVRQMALFWGIMPHVVVPIDTTDVLVEEVENLLEEMKYVRDGDKIVIVASLPPSVKGKTNFLKIHEVREGSVIR